MQTNEIRQLRQRITDLENALKTITDHLERVGDMRRGKDGPYVEEARLVLVMGRNP